MGGEKPNRILWDNFKRGSPPHGRGKGSLIGRFGSRIGITPAWAGKRILKNAQKGGYWDHPRMGGEKGGIRL